nr:hypothetical protein [Tanacetum cinerariifolium]
VYGTNRSNHVDVTSFVDSDYAKDPDKERSWEQMLVGTEHNVVDALTKVVPGLKLQHCLELLNVGVANIKPKVEIVEFSLYFSESLG